MNLDCYVLPGWVPGVHPSVATREWMTESPDSYAYRCLPLNIANSHGWVVECPCDFTAIWNGGTYKEAITLTFPENVQEGHKPVTLFGLGVITFHIQGIFRTDPEWNLWVGPIPNDFKDGISALTGIIETDWSPYTFTMNWKFTRPNHMVTFKKGEPICFMFPVQRHILDDVEPKIVQMSSNEDLQRQFGLWNISRNQFHAKMKSDPPKETKDSWQKHYYTGVDMDGKKETTHQTKLRVKEFT